MATRETIRTLSVYDQIDERFTKGQVPSVISFIEGLEFPITMSFTGTTALTEATKDEAFSQDLKDSAIYYDYGDGRVSKGMRGLELLSKLCKGVSPNDLYMFNNVIYSSNPTDISSASREDLIRIVINNLGMFDIVNKVTPIALNKVETFNELCYQIGYLVKSGTYRRQTMATQILVKCRELVQIAARANLLNGVIK